MSWRALFGVDLSGKLSAWKRRYQGDVRTFDRRNVWCRITSWRGGIHTVSASVRCTDPNANMDTRPIAWIYNVDGFTLRVEAEAHIEAEIRKATRKHKDTAFFRYHLALPGQFGGR